MGRRIRRKDKVVEEEVVVVGTGGRELDEQVPVVTLQTNFLQQLRLYYPTITPAREFPKLKIENNLIEKHKKKLI
jgi:hypothetical protein